MGIITVDILSCHDLIKFLRLILKCAQTHCSESLGQSQYMLQMHEGKREKLLVLRVDGHLNPSHISGRIDFLVLESTMPTCIL